MRRYSVRTILLLTVIVVVVAGGVAAAANRWVISSINQIKPSVRSALVGPGIVRIVDSPKVVLQPGQSSYDTNPTDFQATCPPGLTVVGTSFDGGGGEVWDVTDYGGFFVGGFIANNGPLGQSGQPTNQAYVAAICALVPLGSVGPSRDISGQEARYRAQLRQDEAKAR